MNKNGIGKKGRNLIFGAVFAAASAAGHAQLAIPALGDLGLLSNLDVLGSFELGGGLPGTDLLGGGFEGLDLAGSLTPNIDMVAFEQMLDPASIGDPTVYLTAVEGVLAIAQSPSTFAPVPLAPPLLRGFVPGFFVLYEAPETLLSFLAGGGSIIDPSLVAVPAVPLLSAPMPLEIPLGELPGLPSNELGLLAPVDVVNLILSSAP